MKFDDQFSVPQHTVCYCKWRRLPLVLAVSLATFILFWGVRSNIDALLSYVVLLKIVLPALLLVLTGRLAFALVHAALRSGSRFAAFGLFVATLAAALVIVNARARLPWLTDMLFTLSLLLYLLLIAVLVLTIMVAFRRSNTALDLVIYFTEFFAANVNLLISTIVNSNRHIFRLTGFYKFFVILSFSFVTIPQLVMSQEASPSSELIPFMCTDDRVLLSQGNPTGLFDISREANPFTFVNVGENSGIVYNAMGFNPEDNFLYALRMVDVDKQGNLIRIDSNGTTIDLGAVANLQQRDYISADFGPVSNILYAADPFRLYLINVQTMEATIGPRFNIGANNFIAVNNADIAYNPIDQHFYTISFQNPSRLLKINPANGFVEEIAQYTTGPHDFGALFIDSLGLLYGNSNSGGFFSFNLQTGQKTLISASPGSAVNDGAICRSSTLTFDTNITVSKSVEQEFYITGENARFTVEVHNAGPFGASGIIVTDLIPQGIDESVVSFGVRIENDGNSLYSLSTDNIGAIDDNIGLGVGASVFYDITINTEGFTGVIENIVNVTVPSSFNNLDGNTLRSEAVTSVVDPILSLSKNVVSVNDENTIVTIKSVGDVISYEILVQNIGDTDIFDIVVEDVLATTGPNYIESSAGSTEGSLKPSEVARYEVRYTVRQEDLNAGKFINTASAAGMADFDSDGVGETRVSSQDNETVAAEQTPAIALIKTADISELSSPVAVGDEITYSFTVTNTGNVTLNDVTLTELVSVFTGAGDLPEPVFVEASAGSTEAALLPDGTLTYTASYTIEQGDIDAGGVTNQAEATGEYVDPDGETQTVSDLSGSTNELDDETVTPLDQDADITLVKTVTSVNGDADATSFTSVGDEIAYAITVTNTGNVTLSDVVVSDPLVGLNETVASLAVGASETFNVSHVVTQADLDAGEVVNVARAQGEGPDGEPTPEEETEVVTPRSGDLNLTKTANRSSVLVGDVVTYTLALENTDGSITRTVDLVDTLPSGFRYQSGSARVAGAAVEPDVSGQTLTWQVIVGPVSTVLITYDVYVGSTAGPGTHINRARGFDPETGAPVTPEASASVRIEAEPVFQCSTVIGRVFDDINHDGYFNEEPLEQRFAITDQDFIPGKGKFWSAPEPAAPRREKGLPGVRLVTPNGIAVTTDEHGRFSLPCAALPRAIGSNFMLKLDDRTLPVGYRMTTENPRVVRLTPGMLTKMNFGAAMFPVARVDLSARAFDAQGEMRPELQAGLQGLVAQVAATPSVVRLSYQAAPDERDAEGNARLRRVEREIRRLWSGTGRYALTVERVVERPAQQPGRQ